MVYHDNGREFCATAGMTARWLKSKDQVREKVVHVLRLHIQMQPKNIKTLFLYRASYPGLKWHRDFNMKLDLYLYFDYYYIIINLIWLIKLKIMRK